MTTARRHDGTTARVCALIGGLALWSVGCNGGGGGTGGPGTGTGTATGTGTGTATGTGTGTGTATGTGTVGASTGGTGEEPAYPGPGEDADGVGEGGDPALLPPVPRTIGSGLPYDVRVQLGEADPGVMSAATDVAWYRARVLDEDTASGSRAWGLRRKGFFPLQVEVRDARLLEGPTDTWSLAYEDDGLYMLDADSNLRTELTVSLYAPDLEDGVFGMAPGTSFDVTHPLVGEGLRPLTVSLVTVPVEGSSEVWFGHAMTWVLDANPSPWEVAYYAQPDMEAFLADAAAAGLRPLSLSGRSGASEDEPPMLAAIVLQDEIPPEEVEVHIGVGVATLEALAQNLGSQVPYALASRAGAPVFEVLTAERALGQVARMEVDLSTDELRSLDQQQRRNGWHLVTATSYRLTPQAPKRWAAVWQRYDPVDRRLREPDVPDWGPWNDAEARVVGLSQGGPTGPTPNQQMAVLEGGVLAYRGAYTFGPVTWPQVRHDSIFVVGSLSKSLTAAVVVQAMADAGLDLDTPLVDVMGWDPGTFTDGTAFPDVDYSNFGVVTIRELLLHWAGFTGDGMETHTKGWREIFQNHLVEQEQLAQIGTPAEVRRLPLSTEALEAWMLGVMTGAIDLPMDPDTMREAAIWDTDYKEIGAVYSNPSYMILGMVADRLTPQGLHGTVRAYAEAAGAPRVRAVNDTRLPRWGLEHPIRHFAGLHLGVPGSPYVPAAPFDPFDEPYFEEEDPFGITRAQVSEWPRLAEPQTPDLVHEWTYSAAGSLRGQTLGAGGFEGSATEIARLFRGLVVGVSMGGLLSDEVALALRTIDPAGDPDFPGGRCGWCYGYGLGVYLYRNWVMGAGTVGGVNSLAAHNVAHDVTFVWIGDLPMGNAFTVFDDDFFDALEDTWPCIEDPQTPRTECPPDIIFNP